MRLRKSLFAYLLSLALASAAVAQTNTPTQTPTSTPTNTPTATNTPAAAVPTLTSRQMVQLDNAMPATKNANLGSVLLPYLINQANDAVKMQVAAGSNATDLPLPDPAVREVIAILAFTTSSGAAATKALITDYTVADGGISVGENLSGQTLLIFYRR